MSRAQKQKDPNIHITNCRDCNVTIIQGAEPPTDAWPKRLGKWAWNACTVAWKWFVG